MAAVTTAVVVVLMQQSDDPWGIHRREAQAEVFDRVWLTVSQNYFDNTFGGVDWPAAKKHYRPLALAARDTTGLYKDAIWPMLSEINTSHLAADAPDPSHGGFTPHQRGKRGEGLADASDGGGDLGGLTIIHDGKHWTVYQVRRGSTPEKLGIGPGRIVTHFTVSPVNDGSAAQRLVELKLAKDGGGEETISYDFPLRAFNHIHRAEKLASGYTLIRFDVFDGYEISWVIDQLKEAGPTGTILDLRHNQGGNIGQLQRLAGALMQDGAPIGRSIGRLITLPLFAPVDGMQYRGPVAVLIGPQTASAAEMLSDSLQHNKRAVLVGDRTAGAVLAARVWKLPDGGWLTVATGNFTTSDGRRLEGMGVTPDITAAETLEATREGRDLVVEAAEQALKARAVGQP